MKKFILLLCVCACSIISFSQNIPSPKDFLGYDIGEHLTPVYKIDAYFNAVAQANPSMVKVQQYGTTNEGREMMVAFISSPQNISNLEEIRKNNLRLTGLLNDGIAANVNTPAIIWLSYSVHGNEPSGSEASMQVLYNLLDATNAQAKQWLQNTVVIIDPCQNPDGHDRYINWFNSAAGSNANADPQSREHNEPWPGGRTNHYNFDLNRDWAWQTQKEMQQKLKLYNDWLPQVHVDLHEQEYNNPYYFAPAAQPYHEVITQWQRDFQVQVGRNDAKYFDQNGWLYFTKEVYDLFYPSYGDTYPTYSGAIGMTYEQGGIGAGLSIKTNSGDTLTLAQRALHHYTASIATIETVSQNASKLVNEYKKYFDDNMNGVDMDYKTYMFTSPDINKIKAVENLLDKNKISYGTTNNSNFSGYNYFDNKIEAFTSEGYQLAVSTEQPKGRLVKVLCEPEGKLIDSSTYDITAWSIAYAQGINTWAVKEKLSIQNLDDSGSIVPVQSNYGVLIPYTSFNAAQLLAQLLKNNIRVRFATFPFTYNNKKYDRGTLIVLKGNNDNDWNNIVNTECAKFNIQPYAVETGFMNAGADFGSTSVHLIKAPKVALLTGDDVSSEAAGEVWCYFDNELNYPITQLIANDLNDLDLSSYNVLIIPAGSYSVLDDKDASSKLEAFVKNGGKIIAVESGAAKLASLDWTGIKLIQDTTSVKDSIIQKKYADADRSSLETFIPGAVFKLQLDNTHPLAYGYPDFYYTLKQDSRVYQNVKAGWNVGILTKNGYTAGFVGSKLKPQLKQGVVIGEKQYGNGRIVFTTDDLLFRLFWQNGKLMFANAVFIDGN